MDNTQVHNISLPQEYFAKSKTEYNNWKQAWFREALQNSVDAGASNIDFEIEETEGGVVVRCQDNGKGMSRETLTNVFLSLGGSQKDEGNTGGFGYAKMILAFAHKSYRVYTKDTMIDGSGGSYTVNDIQNRDGVLLEVDFGHEVKKDEMEFYLNQIVTESALRSGVVVTLNGNQLSSKDVEHPYSYETELGLVRFDDSASKGGYSTVWVRMNGLAMFAMEIWKGGDSPAFVGTLDLNGNSLEMLTSNRDSLSRDKSRALNRIFNQLSNDREKLKLGSKLKTTLNKVNLSVEDFNSEAVAAFDASGEKIGFSDLLDKLNNDEISEKEVQDLIRENSAFAPLVQEAINQRNSLKNEMKKIPHHLYPNNFRINEFSDASGSHSRKDLIKSMNLKKTVELAHGWDAIVRRILDVESIQALLNVSKDGDGQFSHRWTGPINTGFVFGQVEGLNESSGEKQFTNILINPIKVREGKLTVVDVVEIAVHELTHITEHYHDESFVNRDAQLRRMVRNEIGYRQLEKLFDEARKGWRNNPSVVSPVADKAPVKALESVSYEPS